MKAHFSKLAEQLSSNETKIVAELNNVQGQAMNIDGYYFPDPEKATKAMRPSETFNDSLAVLA